MPVDKHTAIVQAPLELFREPSCIGNHTQGAYDQVCFMCAAIAQIHRHWPPNIPVCRWTTVHLSDNTMEPSVQQHLPEHLASELKILFGPYPVSMP